MGRDSEGTSGPPVSCLELELEGELDGTGAADLVEGVEAAIGAAGAEAAGQRLCRVTEQRAGKTVDRIPEVRVTRHESAGPVAPSMQSAAEKPHQPGRLRIHARRCGRNSYPSLGRGKKLKILSYFSPFRCSLIK